MCTTTVFTPTYNRAYILGELYKSLQQQTTYQFEWLIVDDGSTDDTNEIVSKWIKEENRFPIHYFKKENGGKHRAINFALQYAHGEYFFIVDSDDCLVPDAIETISKQMKTLPTDGYKKYAGICNCRGYSPTEIMGTSFEGDYIDCTSLEREKYGITGDKAEVFYTEIMRQYPFPEFDGEKFITECVVWDKMAADGYYLRYFNIITYLCEYRDDGLTMKGLDLFYRNPQGYGYTLRLARQYKKYSKPMSDYLDAECYLHWKKEMSPSEIATLIGTTWNRLLYITLIHYIRDKACKIKHKIKSIAGGASY